MKAQQPAKGILMQSDYGDMKFYRVECDCSSESHSQIIEVEADDTHVSVVITSKIYTKHSDGIWQSLINKIRYTCSIWFKGYVDAEHSILLKEQAALNYAATIKNAVRDVKLFRKNSKEMVDT